VDQVERVAHGAPEPVERVHDDHVAVAGVGDELSQPGAIDGRAGLLVEVDPLERDPDVGERVDLTIEVLLDHRDARVAEVHDRTVPQVVPVGRLRHAFVKTTCGTPLAGFC
jgi:hypothetical protein